MPKAISTTTMRSMYSSYDFDTMSFNTVKSQATTMEQFQKLQIMQEISTTKVLVAYAITFGPLAICFLCCLFPYLSAFRRNLHAHAQSTLLPMITHTYRTIKFNYTMFFIFGIATGAVLAIPKGYYASGYIFNVFFVLCLAITWYVSMYQLAISIISIHRFINSRQPEELRGALSRKNVIVLMIIIFLVVIFKDIGWAAYVIVIFVTNELELLDTWLMYYSMIYVTYQILLFIAMAFQFTISEEPKSHSEYCIATHTKYIGLTKLILGVIYFVCYLINFETLLANMLFFSIDLFLVPVVIEITEIKANPNVITATEIKKVPISA